MSDCELHKPAPISRSTPRQRHDKHAHKLPALLLARAARPERPERGHALVQALLLLHGVVVKVQRLALVPAVLIHDALAPLRAREPLLARLYARGAARPALRRRVRLRARRERRERKVLLELELVLIAIPVFALAVPGLVKLYVRRFAVELDVLQTEVR